jgi:hypothetical protein
MLIKKGYFNLYNALAKCSSFNRALIIKMHMWHRKLISHVLKSHESTAVCETNAKTRFR